MNITELRPKFVEFIKQNSTASEIDISDRADTVPTQANDPAEQYLPTLAETYATSMKNQDLMLRQKNLNAKLASQSTLKATAENKRLRDDRAAHKDASRALDNMMAGAEVELEAVHPGSFKKADEPGIFMLELHRASIQDGNGLLAEPKGTLFVDTTPDQPNVQYFIAPASPERVEAYRKTEREENDKLFEQQLDQIKQLTKLAEAANAAQSKSGGDCKPSG